MEETFDPDQIQYSVVIPVYNESTSMPLLCNALRRVMDRLKLPYEIIFIDDASKQIDGDIMTRAIDKSVTRIIKLPKRLGQTGALIEGFRNARGRFVISMDGDMQDNPEHIPSFIDEINKGFDVVCGHRIKRADAGYKVVLSRLGNYLQRLLLRTNIHDISCTYRIYNRDCIGRLKRLRKGYHRYIPFILLRQGCKVAEIRIEQCKRSFGYSKYGLGKIPEVISSFSCLILDIITRRI